MRRIYIAGPFEKRIELQAFATHLKTVENHEVTSRWLGPDWPEEALNPLLSSNRARGIEYAIKDIEDITRADTFILFSDGNGRGGRNVELGYALCAKNIEHVIIVGPPTTIFHLLPNLLQCHSAHDCITALRQLK